MKTGTGVSALKTENVVKSPVRTRIGTLFFSILLVRFQDSRPWRGAQRTLGGRLWGITHRGAGWALDSLCHSGPALCSVVTKPSERRVRRSPFNRLNEVLCCFIRDVFSETRFLFLLRCVCGPRGAVTPVSSVPCLGSRTGTFPCGCRLGDCVSPGRGRLWLRLAARMVLLSQASRRGLGSSGVPLSHTLQTAAAQAGALPSHAATLWGAWVLEPCATRPSCKNHAPLAPSVFLLGRVSRKLGTVCTELASSALPAGPASGRVFLLQRGW